MPLPKNSKTFAMRLAANFHKTQAVCMGAERTVMVALAPIVPLAAQKIRYAQDSYPEADAPPIF
jgi:hypothetical protein